jgi:hypothetical protein
MSSDKGHDKLNIADEMIEAAIAAFLDDQRYFAALNLAAVAEELYGKYVRLIGEEDIQLQLVNAANKIGARQGSDFTVKDWKKVANYYKNAVKHFDSESDRFLEIDAREEARSMIGMALTNHSTLEREYTPVIDRFYVFAKNWAKSQGNA